MEGGRAGREGGRGGGIKIPMRQTNGRKCCGTGGLTETKNEYGCESRRRGRRRSRSRRSRGSRGVRREDVKHGWREKREGAREGGGDVGKDDDTHDDDEDERKIRRRNTNQAKEKRVLMLLSASFTCFFTCFLYTHSLSISLSFLHSTLSIPPPSVSLPSFFPSLPPSHRTPRAVGGGCVCNRLRTTTRM